jgi:hypothetical protein
MCIVTEQRGNLPGALNWALNHCGIGEEHNLEILAGPALDGNWRSVHYIERLSESNKLSA